MALRKRGGKAAKQAPNADEAPAPAKKKTAKKKAASKKTAAKKAPAATRGPRVDYGYAKGATIELTGDKSYRGKRGELYDVLKTCDGKTVEDFAKKAAKVLAEGEPVRGWLRFFVTDGAAELQGGEE